jgi:polysaccharide biosynthesis protein PslH
VRFLFLKHSLKWPRVRGHDVHTYSIMQALGTMGHSLNLFTIERPEPAALGGLCTTVTVSADVDRSAGAVRLRGLQDRFRSYWGIAHEDLNSFAAAVDAWRPDVIVAAGPEVLPYLAGVSGARRVWYAADDLCWQHMTQIRLQRPDTWANVLTAAINAVYERAFTGSIDRVWVVSATDAQAIRWIGGIRGVDVIPNGVDTNYFQPTAATEDSDTAVFWGNLQFAPNVRAVEWFCSNVWPIVRQRRPAAVLTIAGYEPAEAVRRFSGREGVNVIGAVDDLRDTVAKHAVAVMPFVAGGGLKNKMLEAAAMARPTVCSRAALNGLCGSFEDAFVVAASPEDWAEQLEALWDSRSKRAALGNRARTWVEANHTWQRAAERALETVA